MFFNEMTSAYKFLTIGIGSFIFLLSSCGSDDNPSSIATDSIMLGTWTGTETVIDVQGEDGACLSSFEDLIGTVFEISVTLEKMDDYYNGRWINHSVNRNVGVRIYCDNLEIGAGGSMGYIPFLSDDIICDDNKKYKLNINSTITFDGRLSEFAIAGNRETSVNYLYYNSLNYAGRVKYVTYVSISK